MNPVLYISVELKVRDLDPRLLVTAEALKAGLHVVIGQQWALSKNIFNVPQGVFLFKTVNEIQATHMVDAREAGHIVTASDEEVLACFSDYCYRSTMGPTAAACLDRFYAQGQRHAEIVQEEFPDLSGKVLTIGNPRIDLLAPWGNKVFLKDVNEIRRSHSPFILFNTNFGWVNSIWNAREDTKQILIRTGRLNLDDPESVARYDETVEWEEANLKELEKTIAWAADTIESHSIVIRPHPAEDRSYWTSRFESRPRVSVVGDGSHIPWTMAADLMVHTSCSTGTEAAVLGVPSLSVTPYPKARQHSNLLSNQINETVETWQDAAEVIQEFISKDRKQNLEAASEEGILSSVFQDFGKGVSAAHMIDDVSQKLGSDVCSSGPDYEWNPLPDHPWVNVERRKEWVQKFSLDDQELANRLIDMGNLVGLKSALNVQKIDDSLFHVFPG